ncbi:MAG: peroxidase family protein [Pseudomonadota bacterium]
MSLLEDILTGAGTALLGKEAVNKIIINKLVNRGRNRPHPWSTRFDDFISWAGLTDKTYFARLLKADRYPDAEAVGTRKPPTADVLKLFFADTGKQIPSAKSTYLFPAFAQYLTDGFLRTALFNEVDPDNPVLTRRKRTTSNHEIDLSALYGRTEKQTDALRTRKGGRLKSEMEGAEEYSPRLYDDAGQLKPEFADLDEPLGLRHGTARKTLFAAGGDRVNANVQIAAINTLFLREHNRLADALATANSGWDDDRLFETARNIVIVMFLKIVVEEYINHISTASFRFLAKPEVAWKADWNRPNWMTIEFTLLYRWHSLVPETFRWRGVPVPWKEMRLDNSLLTKDGLANAFVEMSANPAARMGLGNFARELEDAEANGFKQARENNLAGYNAYREAMGFKRAKTFAEIVGTSKDPVEQAARTKLAADLERLYGTVDNVEFYTGLFAEPCQANGPLPDLLLAMVAMDAFSQALPNPLLSEHVWGDKDNRPRAFTDWGRREIDRTSTLLDLLERNAPGLNGRFVGMTRPGWKRS